MFVWNSHEETFSSSGIQLCLNVLKGISLPLPALPELKTTKLTHCLISQDLLCGVKRYWLLRGIQTLSVLHKTDLVILGSVLILWFLIQAVQASGREITF